MSKSHPEIAPVPRPAPSRPGAPTRSRAWVWIVLLLLAAGGGAYGWHRLHGADKPAATTASAPSAVPVTLAAVETSDVPVVLDGLGTVQAYNTVTVRTRIDGQIETIGFRQGQSVQAGDLLVQIDARPYRAALQQATAKKTQDEAILANSKLDLQRFQRLGEFGTRQQLDTQTALVAQQTAQLASDQAAVDNAETQLSYATIRAPITGLAGFRLVDVGNIVNAATQTGIVTLTQLEPIYVVYTAPEDHVPDINRALAAGEVKVGAFTSDGSRQLSEGRLEIVNNQVDTASGTIKLKATFANADRALWPGLSVTTRMQTGSLPGALTVPETGVQHGPDGLFVFKVDAGMRAHVQRIKVRLTSGGRAVVTEGLSAGDRVVTEGQYRVQEGTLVAERTEPVRQSQAGAP